MSEFNIYEQLRRVQIELKAPKDEKGRFGKSRSAEKILEAVKLVLDKHGLTIIVSDEIVQVGDRHYVKATASLYNTNSASVSATAHAWEGDIDRGLDASQVTGKTSSYARKYALGGLLAIDDTKDADTSPETPRATRPAVGTSKPEDEPATPTQKARIKAFLTSRAIKTDEMPDYLERNFGVIPGSVMTKVDAESIITELSA